MSSSSAKMASPPYPPTTAALGGVPTKSVDDPISSVFMCLFIFGAITHMTIFQINRRRGQKFIMSAMLFGFCVSRTLACILRIVWASYPKNISVGIAAQIFVNVGVILLFVINLIFAQRTIRASHPHFGWHKLFSWAFILYYVSIVLVIIALIIAIVQSFYTLSTNTHRIDTDVQLFGSTYFAVAAFLPLVLVALRKAIPIRHGTEKFGKGRFRTKIAILVFSSILLSLGAAFRAGTNYLPRPISDPAWYQSKACFYLFNFTIDITVVYLYAVIRVDKRFIVPNNSKGPGDYTAQKAEGSATEQPSMFRIKSEEEVFDDRSQPEGTESREKLHPNGARGAERDLEAQRGGSHSGEDSS